jgi:hypothetical protein
MADRHRLGRLPPTALISAACVVAFSFALGSGGPRRCHLSMNGPFVVLVAAIGPSGGNVNLKALTYAIRAACLAPGAPPRTVCASRTLVS